MTVQVHGARVVKTFIQIDHTMSVMISSMMMAMAVTLATLMTPMMISQIWRL